MRERLSASGGGFVSAQLYRFGRNGEWARGIAEFSTAGEHVGERVARGFDGQGFSFARRDGDIYIYWIGSDAVHWSFPAPERSANQADVGAVIVGDFGYVVCFHFLITRIGHFQRGGKIGPELEAMHASSVIAFRHFLMDDATACGHPLDIAGRNRATVTHAVAMFDGAGQDVGNGFDAAMRMPRETGEVILRNVVAKIVEQQKGIEFGSVVEAESSAQMDAGTVEGRFGLDQTFYRAYGHGNELPVRESTPMSATLPTVGTSGQAPVSLLRLKICGCAGNE